MSTVPVFRIIASNGAEWSVVREFDKRPNDNTIDHWVDKFNQRYRHVFYQENWAGKLTLPPVPQRMSGASA